MEGNLRFDIGDHRLNYAGRQEIEEFVPDQILEFNHRHKAALGNYDLALESCRLINLHERTNQHSNLGALRNRQLRQAVVLSAGLSAAAVALHGRGRFNEFPKEKQTPELAEQLKRANDRTSAQVMADILQTTTETLPMGEEVIIESAIARPKARVVATERAA